MDWDGTDGWGDFETAWVPVSSARMGNLERAVWGDFFGFSLLVDSGGVGRGMRRFGCFQVRPNRGKAADEVARISRTTRQLEKTRPLAAMSL